MMTALSLDFPLPFFDGIGTLLPPTEREGKASLNKIKNKYYGSYLHVTT